MVMKKIIFCAVVLFFCSSVMGIERTFQGNDYQFGTTSSMLGAGNTDGGSGRVGRRTIGVLDDATGEENTPGEWNQPQHGNDPLHDTPTGDGVVVLLLFGLLYAGGKKWNRLPT